MTLTTTIIIARHAETFGNASHNWGNTDKSEASAQAYDPLKIPPANLSMDDLNPRGWEQSRLLAHVLAKWNITACYGSTLVRLKTLWHDILNLWTKRGCQGRSFEC